MDLKIDNLKLKGIHLFATDYKDFKKAIELVEILKNADKPEKLPALTSTYFKKLNAINQPLKL